MTEFETGLRWTKSTVIAIRPETAEVKTIAFRVPGWGGHRAGQHVDIRLTAADGYVAQRSYSLASPGGGRDTIELTVQSVRGGEVSSFLLEELQLDDVIEIRGPIGGYFTWTPDRPDPLMLIGGGSGIVPLMAMLRTRAAAPGQPARLLYSSRTAAQIIYAQEMAELTNRRDGLSVVHTLTREQPAGWSGEHGRIDRMMLSRHLFATAEQPDIFVCGPTPFVEAVAEQLISIGHDSAKIRTQRFGPSGGDL